MKKIYIVSLEKHYVDDNYRNKEIIRVFENRHNAINYVKACIGESIVEFPKNLSEICKNFCMYGSTYVFFRKESVKWYYYLEEHILE